jgi:vacuolar-type H+-ATPase subunit H
VIKQPSDADLERVDAAFNRVLAAEASARGAVDSCRIEADRLLADAEDHARRLVERTDRRLLAVQRIAEVSLQQALSELLDRVAEPHGEGLDAAADARLDAAIAALADEMIGAAVGFVGREGAPR